MRTHPSTLPASTRALCALVAGSALFFGASTTSAEEPVREPPSAPLAPAEVSAQPTVAPVSSAVPASPATATPGPRAFSALAPPAAAPLPEHRNNGMRIAGIVITSLSIAGALAGTGLVIDAATCTADQCGLIAIPAIIGLPISLGLSAIGVPLWVVGTLPPKAPQSAAVPAWVPESVTVGPTSGSLRWTF